MTTVQNLRDGRSGSLPPESSTSRNAASVVPRSTDRGTYDGRFVRLDGRRLQNFGSSSFLGLELRAELAQGARDAMCAYGTAAPFSRVHIETPLHAELEELLAQMTGAAAVLVTPSAALAHVAALPAIVGANDAVLLDQRARSSLHTAAAVLKGIPVELVRSSRIARLDETVELLATKYERVWLLLDGLDATFGSFTPLDALAGLLEKHPKLHLYIDDSESTSWYGHHGRGAAQQRFAAHPRVVVTLGLDGSFAASGAALLFADAALHERVRGGAEALLASVAAPVLGAAVASAKFHLRKSFGELQAALRRRVEFMYELAEIGRIPFASLHKTPIFFLHTGTPERAFELARSLEVQGFYVCPVPFVPRSPCMSGVRFTVSVQNEIADIERFADVLGREAERLRRLRQPIAAAAE